MLLALLGRQAKLGLAELESLVGAPNVRPVGTIAALVDGVVDPDRLGSVIRLALPLTEIASTDWRKISRELEQQLQKITAHLPAGKVKLGLSVFGLPVGAKQLFAAGLDLKKALRASGRSARIIPNNEPELNSAQVLHNGLTAELGIELLVIKNGAKTWLARTTWVQDIDAYAARDQARPKRDAFVGMLPPKLAQTMLNLAGVQPGERVLDPFCGTGVVLQEAALLGCPTYGTDISPKMVDYSAANMQWLAERHAITEPVINEGDAITYKWHSPIDHVVCETYLGQPLSGLPKPEKLAEIMQDCNTIITKFLKNLHPQLQKGTRHCIAVPAWRVGPGFKHLNLLDHLEDLGYNHLRFQHAAWDELMYHREDQIVARELLVITVK